MNTKRTVLITGGTDGIGLKLAQRYSNTGADVAVTGRRPLREIKAVLPANISYIRADQSEPENAAQSIIDGLQKIGWRHCDLAILNAGNGSVCPPLEEEAENLRNTLDVNLAAPIAITHALTSLLFAAHNGKLTIIGSTSHRGAENFASYAASKAGLNGFSRSLREEWRGRVNVQIIHPGPIATGMHTKAGFEPGMIKHVFLDPDFVTRTIIRKIESGRSPVSISFFARALDYLTLRSLVSQ
jgi:NAD(P)-dependent dehydrogenase (short-subunit alcohol dehydrogenase family)